MKKNKILDISDEDLARNYIENPKQEIIFILMKKYNNRFDQSIRKLLSKYPRISLLPEDFFSYKYLSIKQSLETFNFASEFKLVQFIIRNFQFMISDYVRKFITKKHQVLNYSKNYDDLAKYHIQTSIDIDPLYFEHQKQVLLHSLNGKDPLSYLEKVVILKKLSDYSFKEISIELNQELKQVQNAYSRAIKKMKKNYQALEN